MKTLISTPHALHDVERTATHLMLVLKQFKYEDSQKVIPSFLRDVITPSRLWRELEPNRSALEKPVEFEGGLKVDALFSSKCCNETFDSTHVEQFARICTRIRNALAHGRDKVSADSVLPTAKNLDLLRPWMHGLAACVGEVVIYAAHH